MTPELLTRKEAAQIIGVSMRTLDRWHRIGVFTATRIGKAKRYHRRNVDRMAKIEGVKP